jgi:glycosyltransferase involved in cell wall biosynthesis
MRTKVTVAIPIYHSEKDIRTCIESFLACAPSMIHLLSLDVAQEYGTQSKNKHLLL